MNPLRMLASADAPGGMSRRVFLKATAATGAGLTLGLYIRDVIAQAPPSAPAPALPDPAAFVRIGTDDTVTVLVKHLEMGQGTFTGLPTLVAEELDAAWSQMRAEGAPANAKLYNNLHSGQCRAPAGRPRSATRSCSIGKWARRHAPC